MKKRLETSTGESVAPKTKKGKKKVDVVDKPKGLGLFDHIKQVRTIQDPDYFQTLTELDLKTFNHFMILRALSMNPELVDDVATLYRFFDKVPSPQFYKLLISIIPSDRRFYPWIKAKKKHKFSEGLISLVASGFEVSPEHAVEYVNILSATKEGEQELFNFCRGFGLTEKEVENLMTDNDRDEE